jgi:large subunit ribosomal protein L25
MPYAIIAQPRTNLGRRSKDELKEMRIPAVIYGAVVESRPISVGRSEFIKIYNTAGQSALVDVTIDGEAPVKVLIKELQRHPVTTDPVHVDFYQVRMDKEMEADIPLVFIGESIAVKNEGGTLVKSMDELAVRCLPGDLPHQIEVDLGVLKTFEDAVTIASLVAPKGVEFLDEPELTIATVARPLTEDELKALEESQVGDVSAVKTEADEKKEEAEAAEGAEGEGSKESTPAEKTS